MKFEIPYFKEHLELNLPKERVKAVLESKAHKYVAKYSEEVLIKNALEKPLNSPQLKVLSKVANKILIITSDHTRPVPSSITLPILLEEIRTGNPDAQIKILIATGCHRLTTYEEMVQKFGNGIVENEELINHDSRDTENMVFKGVMPSGGELWLNSLVDWAELIISEGFIEPHFFAGFSGGRKSILPGIAAEKTVLANHCSRFIASSDARTGKLENNPIHKDMLFAAGASKLRFILNVVLDGEKKIIKAFAGDPSTSHMEGCSFVDKLGRVQSVKADIVITSNGGYPLDQNIYQAVKGMTAAEACVNEGGVIIMVAACNDGHGGEAFYRWFTEATSAEEIASQIALIPQDQTTADQWEAQILARILLKCTVILVTDMCKPQIIKNMKMLHADSLSSALVMAEERIGKQAQVVIIPDGVSMIVQ